MVSIVAKLMGEAARSTRLMALLSLQLTKLVTSSPALMPFYADVYLQMLLFGAPITDQPGIALEVGAPSFQPSVPGMLFARLCSYMSERCTDGTSSFAASLQQHLMVSSCSADYAGPSKSVWL